MTPAARALEFDLSGVRVRISALKPPLSERLAEDWREWRAAGPGEPFLDVAIRDAVLPPPQGPFAPKAMIARLSRDAATYRLPEGDAEARVDGTASVRLSESTDADRRWYAFLNLLRACIAWRMPSRGGALLHAAGAVIGDRAFLLVGPEGSGKSTWARWAEYAGAPVLSDDLVLIDGAGEGFDALGAPFRSTHGRTAGPGRWPVAAVLLPRAGECVRLDPVSDLVLRARLAANLPFIAEGLEVDPRVGRTVDRLAALPAHVLTFAPDSSFVGVLAALAARHSGSAPTP